MKRYLFVFLLIFHQLCFAIYDDNAKLDSNSIKKAVSSIRSMANSKLVFVKHEEGALSIDTLSLFFNHKNVFELISPEIEWSSDGSSVWQYQKETEQIIIEDIKSFSEDELPHKIFVQLLSWPIQQIQPIKNGWMTSFLPKNFLYETVEILFSKRWIVKKLILTENIGTRTTYSLISQKKQRKYRPVLKNPNNIEVIDLR